MGTLEPGSLAPVAWRPWHKKDQVREQRRQEEIQKILSMDISNPYHDMNIEDLKKHALSLCQRKLQESVSQSGLGTPTHPPHKRICHMMGLSGTSPYDVFVYLCICIFCFCTFDTLDYHFWYPWTIPFSKICHMLGLSGTSQYAVYVYLCILLLYLSFSLYLSSPYDRRDHPLYGNISNEVSDMILGCWGGCL